MRRRDRYQRLNVERLRARIESVSFTLGRLFQGGDTEACRRAAQEELRSVREELRNELRAKIARRR